MYTERRGVCVLASPRASAVKMKREDQEKRNLDEGDAAKQVRSLRREHSM